MACPIFKPVLSHPDYDRRLWSYTKSADPNSCNAFVWRSRASMTYAIVTAGGELHPALRTYSTQQNIVPVAHLNEEKVQIKLIGE